MPIPTDEERIGTLVADRYRLDSILGRGGMGVVYGGEHVLTERRVAIKILKPDHARDASGVRRFLQEARAAASLDHPNVVGVLDVGTDESGTIFMALERLDGETLGEKIAREGAIDARELIELLVPAMSGVQAAHDRGILHRDLKPDNIFLARDRSGRVTAKVLDFGMSKLLGESFGNTTDTGTLIGTPYYMAPEQAEGAKDIGPAADVWSLGALLYHAMSGARPFDAPSPPALLLKIARGQRTPLAERAPHVPIAIARVIDRALSLDRSERWPTVAAFSAALRNALHDVSAEHDLASASSTSRTYAPLAVAVAASAIAIAAGTWVLAEPEAPAPSVAPDAIAAPPPRDAAPPRSEPLPAPAPQNVVHIASEPAGALVEIDGANVCTTPCDLPRADVARDAIVRAPGHRASRVRIEPTRAEIDVVLRAQRTPSRRAAPPPLPAELPGALAPPLPDELR